MNPIGRCSQCRYFDELENRKGVGRCLRYPPVIVIAKAQLRPLRAAKVHLTSGEIQNVVEGFEALTLWQSTFPLVEPGWSCGEFVLGGEAN